MKIVKQGPLISTAWLQGNTAVTLGDREEGDDSQVLEYISSIPGNLASYDQGKFRSVPGGFAVVRCK